MQLWFDLGELDVLGNIARRRNALHFGHEQLSETRWLSE